MKKLFLSLCILLCLFLFTSCSGSSRRASKEEQYDSLLEEYADLESRYGALYDEYITLFAENDDLKSRYGALYDEYITLSSNYESLLISSGSEP